MAPYAASGSLHHSNGGTPVLASKQNGFVPVTDSPMSLASSLGNVSLDSTTKPGPWTSRTMPPGTTVSGTYPLGTDATSGKPAPPRYVPRASMESIDSLDEPFGEATMIRRNGSRVMRSNELRSVQSVAGLGRQYTSYATPAQAIDPAHHSQPSSPVRQIASPRSSVQLSRDNSRSSNTMGVCMRTAMLLGRCEVRVNPAILSSVARAFEALIVPLLRPSHAHPHILVFDGKEAIDKLQEICRIDDRNLALLLGRALEAQDFLHGASSSSRLRDSEQEMYLLTNESSVPWKSSPASSRQNSFSSVYGYGRPSFGAYEAELAQSWHDCSAIDDTNDTMSVTSSKKGYPTGVFTLLTGCYSPTCSKGNHCYSITCPYLLEKQSQLVVHPSLQHSDSHESLVDITSQLWAESVSKEVYESVSERERKRQEVIFEIISTERAYVQDLEYLRDIWMQPLSTQHVLPDSRRAEFVQKVFRNLLDILAINSRLADMLTRRQRHRSVVEYIGDIFAELVPHFEPYVYYGANQAAAKLRLEDERAINPVFAMFVEDTERKAISRKLQVNGFLTKPTARLSRYPLLFEQMLKYTSDDNMDKILLPKVIRQIQHFLSLTNDETGKSENRIQLGFLSQQLQFKPNEMVDLKLGEVGRELVFKNALKKRGTQSDSSEIQVYLFDHALLMVKIKIIHKNEVFKVYRRPIPLEFLQVTIYEDTPTPKGTRTRWVYSRSSIGNRTSIGPSLGQTPMRQDNKTGYAITFTYLGKLGYSLTLWASTLATRNKWLEHIETRQQIVRNRSCVFDLVPASPFMVEQATNQITCAVPFDFGHQVFFSRKDGIYLLDLRDRSCAPSLILPLTGVTQMDVLEEYQILIVLAEQVMYTFTLDALDAADPIMSMKQGRRIASHTSFFRAGICLGRTLVCVVKSGPASSTIKTLEPIDFHLRVKKQLPFRKALQGGQDTLRVFKEFYIPTESSSIHFLKSKLCVGTAKGFEIVDLETLDTQGLLDPADLSLDFVQRQENLKPIAIFRIDGEFLLCYNEFAFYVNKNGWRAKGQWLINWEGNPTSFALHYPYVLAFDPQFIEVRSVETGALHQVITGYNVRCLFADSAASSLATSRIHHARTQKFGMPTMSRTHPVYAPSAMNAPAYAATSVSMAADTSGSQYTSSTPPYIQSRTGPYGYSASPSGSPYASPAMSTSSFSFNPSMSSLGLGTPATASSTSLHTPFLESLLSSRNEILMAGDSSTFLIKPHSAT